MLGSEDIVESLHVSGKIKQSAKHPPKVPTDKILQQVADFARVPTAKRKMFFDSVRKNVQAACEWDEIIKGGLANGKGTTLHEVTLTLYDKLGTLNNHERKGF